MARMKGKYKRPESVSGGYGAIPWSVIDSNSFKGASDRARSLLFALVRQHDGKNNGHLHLVDSWLAKQGWRSKDSNAKGRNELIERGLIVKTRTGGLNMGPSFYALTWHTISNYFGLDISAKNYQRGKYLLCSLPPTKLRKPPIKKIKRPDCRDSVDPSIGAVGGMASPTTGSKKRINYRLTTLTSGDNVLIPLPVNNVLPQIVRSFEYLSSEQCNVNNAS